MDPRHFEKSRCLSRFLLLIDNKPASMKPNLALTPPMGWNSWNSFGEHITEADVRATADALVATGLAAAGYQYVVIDDHWHGETRVDGKLTWNPQKFPSGIPALADYVHRKGLKFGIYSCAGTHTCGGKPASFRQEEIDARTFAEWGVDFLKYDFCFFPAEANGPASYRRMAQALRNCGRDIVFSLCNWGRDDLHTWARHSGGHLWRTAGDIKDKWSSIYDLGFRRQKDLHPYAGPGGWNDPDMLVVGMRGQGKNLEVIGDAESPAEWVTDAIANEGPAGCTDDEYRSHFALWCLQAAPLIIGADIRALDPNNLQLLLNRDLIAVNQDSLGIQARCLGSHRSVQTWSKPLADGDIAVGLFNLGKEAQWKAPVSWECLGLPDHAECRVTELVSGEDRGIFTRFYNSAGIPSHGCEVLRIHPL